MGLKIRSDSVCDILLMAQFINDHMEENDVSLLHVDENAIQKRYDEFMNDIAETMI